AGSAPPTCRLHSAAATGLAAIRLRGVPAGVPVLSDVPIAAGACGHVPPQFEPTTGVESKSGRGHHAGRCAFSFARPAGPVGEFPSSWAEDEGLARRSRGRSGDIA